MKNQYQPDDSFVTNLYSKALAQAGNNPVVNDTQFFSKKVAAKVLKPVRMNQIGKLKAQLAALENEVAKWSGE